MFCHWQSIFVRRKKNNEINKLNLAQRHSIDMGIHNIYIKKLKGNQLHYFNSIQSNIWTFFFPFHDEMLNQEIPTGPKTVQLKLFAFEKLKVYLVWRGWNWCFTTQFLQTMTDEHGKQFQNYEYRYAMLTCLLDVCLSKSGKTNFWIGKQIRRTEHENQLNRTKKVKKYQILAICWVSCLM